MTLLKRSSLLVGNVLERSKSSDRFSLHQQNFTDLHIHYPSGTQLELIIKTGTVLMVEQVSLHRQDECMLSVINAYDCFCFH